MTTATAAAEATGSSKARVLAGGALALVASAWTTFAAPQLGPWVPLFQGIDHLVATNVTASTDFDHRMVANALRVDLRDPDVRLLTTPRIDNYQANIRETAGRTVSRFLQVHQLQVAVNGTFFSPSDYYLPEGTAMTVRGLQVSGGLVVSSATDASPVLLFDAQNQARFIATNTPSASTAGVETAISGDYPLVVGGENIGRRYLNLPGFLHDPNPRTAIGVSQDGRYLYLLTIDGRQPGYSEGALDYETGAWLKLIGAHDGMNLDGGGSTTMAMESGTGLPVRLNRSSAVADSGKERTVGSHIGVYAKPLVGFIRQVTAQPDDTTAKVSWVTAAPASGQVEYGPTPDMGLATPLQTDATTEHTVQLTGLKADTDYYYRVVSVSDGTRHVSPDLLFTTTNHATLQVLIGLTDPWLFTARNQDGLDWTSVGASEAGWSGPGEGLLWVDVRPTGPNPNVVPKGAMLPANPANGGYPYLTYYFRKHFTFRGKVPGVTLRFSGYLDDGAVFYLNGREIQRLRMEDAPAPIANDTLAIGFACDGDATCPDEFAVEGPLADALVEGENVLAVEVHNYNPRSADTTFGMTVTAAIPPPTVLPTPSLTVTAGVVRVAWDGTGLVLQQAAAPDGPWVDLKGATSPWTSTPEGVARYFRLRR